MSNTRSEKRTLEDDSLPTPELIHSSKRRRNDKHIAINTAVNTPPASSPDSSEASSSPSPTLSSRSPSLSNHSSFSENEEDTMLGPLLVKRLSKKARIPTRGSKHAAGFDLYSAKAMTIPAQRQGLVPTDISIAVPAGTYGRVAPRSGLALKHFVDVGAGVVDYDYRGPLGIVLFNFGQKDFVIEEGDRIAQLVLEKIHLCDAQEVEELDDTERGSGGFGSTGIKLV